MSAHAFDTLEAAKSLRAAGFDEARAEAVVATVDNAVREHVAPLASGIAVIEATMATKGEVETVKSGLETVKNGLETVKSGLETVKNGLETVKGEVESIRERVETVESNLEFVKERVTTISDTMATREYVQAAIALEMKVLYRHLWVMGTSAIGVTVALIKLLP